MTDIFWDVATSAPALGADGLLLLAAAVVGWLPFMRLIPVIGPYVPTARLVAVLLALLMAFLVGFRIADEREEAKSLRNALATKTHDLEAVQRARADDLEQTTQIEGNANAQHALDQAYIASLQNGPGCGFDPGPARAGRVRVVPLRSWAGNIFGPKARPPVGARPDDGAASAGSAALCRYPWYGVEACRGLNPAAMLRLTVTDDSDVRKRLGASRAWYEKVRRDYGGK